MSHSKMYSLPPSFWGTKSNQPIKGLAMVIVREPVQSKLKQNYHFSLIEVTTQGYIEFQNKSEGEEWKNRKEI